MNYVSSAAPRSVTIGALAFVLLLFAFGSELGAEDALEDFRYQFETLSSDLPQPMQLALAPDGRIFFIEIAGKVKCYQPKTRQTVEVGSLEVTNLQENGLLGMALDPNFGKNGWIYLLHSPPNFSGQILSRFTVAIEKLDMGSRKDLLNYAEQREQCCHHAGALRFGPEGCLYISTGDNTNPFASDGFSPHDDRVGRGPWDAQKSSANTNDLRGKILRIRPTADGGYEIPPGNLFPPGTAQTRPEIYAMGFRNPWRFNIDSQTGIVYVGDVGPDARDANEERGPRGFDTISQVRAPAYLGWPYARGPETYVAYNFEQMKSGAKFDRGRPQNSSANNTGQRELPPVSPPLIWYPAKESKEFPELGIGGRTACAGPVYHFDASFRVSGGLPEKFDRCLLIYDWDRPFLKWARLDKAQKLVAIEPFSAAVNVGRSPSPSEELFTIKRPVDMVFGLDGALYLLDYGETWGKNDDSRLVRISYQRSNLAPRAKASGQRTTGPTPLTVELSATGSRDPEGLALTYEWHLQPGDRVVSTEREAKFTLPEAGNFRAEVRVTDPLGASSSASVALTSGNTPPEIHFVTPQDGDFISPGKPIQYEIAVNDAEDGNSERKADEFAARTLVTSAWTNANGNLAEPDPGFARMKQSDCFNCHALETPLVGPPLVAVAARYRSQPGAESATVERVIKGSTGIWGQVGMLPHPQHTEDEVQQMVRWIFSLEPGSSAAGVIRGLRGEVPVSKEFNGGACRIEAVFTDGGAPPAGSLSAGALVTLRSRRIEADRADEISGPVISYPGRATGKKALGSIGHGHFIKFANIALDGTSGFTIRAASGGPGGEIEFHRGSPQGQLLAVVKVSATGGWENYADFSAPLSVPSQGRADVYAVFTHQPKRANLMTLDWVQFDEAQL